MTLRELFAYIGDNPTVLVLYFLALPALALLMGWISKDEGHVAPWKHIYAMLIFGVCVPGIFSVALSVYNFLFERGSLMNANVLIQILPILSMILTLAIIRRNVPFDMIPGSERINNLMMTIAAVFMLMYLLDRTRIFAFVNIPVQYLLVIVLGLLLAVRYGLRRLV
jgi:hypothetical protein